MEQFVFEVEDTSCTDCGKRMRNAVEQIEGVHRITADHETATVEITGDPRTKATVREAIYDAGYDVDQ